MSAALKMKLLNGWLAFANTYEKAEGGRDTIIGEVAGWCNNIILPIVIVIIGAWMIIDKQSLKRNMPWVVSILVGTFLVANCIELATSISSTFGG